MHPRVSLVRQHAGPLLLSAALGILVSIAVTLAMALIRPIYLAVALAGLAVFLPTLVVTDAKRYWFTLFIVSFLFDNVSKRLTTWIANPVVLADTLGMPPGGNLSIHLHLSDVILVVMLIPWLLQLLTRRRSLYLPRISFLALGYLSWALFASLARSSSLALSLFELFHQALYFVTFLFVVNNVDRKAMVQALMQGVMILLALESIIIIAMFCLQSFAFVFSEVYDIDASQQRRQNYAVETRAEDTFLVRSRGTFNHPGTAAAFLVYLLPLSLMLAIARPTIGNRMLYASLFAVGAVALILTFSRAGFLAVLLSIATCVWMARRRSLIGPRAFRALAALAIVSMLATAPFIWDFLARRPAMFKYRFVLIEGGLELVLRNPLLGVGLANSNHATRQFWAERGETGGQVGIVIHNQYLIHAVEIGLLGAALYYAFFVLVARNAVGASRSKDADVRALSIAMLASLLGLALQTAADPFAGNALHSMLWIYAGFATALAGGIGGGAVRSREPRCATTFAI